MSTNAKGEFRGMACRWLGNEQVQLAVTTDRGPRIVFWGWHDGPNLFAELPEAVMVTPAGPYHFLGGHRLWYAPEVLDRTYWPDNAPLTVADIAGGASFAAPSDGAGIAKQLTITVSADAPEVQVAHTLHNTGLWTVRLAPWPLSMCRMGGTAILPQPHLPTDPYGLLPNRRLSLWPYTDVRDPRLLLGNQVTLINATPGANNKIGYRNVQGWFAYWLDGTLFSKHFDPQLQGDHPDQGCNAEFYFAQEVIELESLGALVDLEPGSSITYTEVWRLYYVPSRVETEADAQALIQTLNLV